MMIHNAVFVTLLAFLSAKNVYNKKKLDKDEVPEYWTKSPVVRPLKIPSLCMSGRDTLTNGKHYQLAVSHAEFGQCLPNDFEILDALGKGGYGAVTLVKQKQTGQLFAMKQFRSNSPFRYNLIRSEECHHYLATSSDAFRSPVSPYVAKFYCSMQREESVRLLVEYVDGETLMAVLTGGAKAVNGRRRNVKVELKDVDIRRLFAQLVLAIEYLHDRGIVFGDLTTRNIMVSTAGNLKLIDFGFSKIIGSGRDDPPQWPNGIRQPAFSENPYIDWYAVGSILYEMAYAKKIQTDKNGPSNPRDIRTAITREQLLRKDCQRALRNSDLCDLIHRFVKQPWKNTWGRSTQTRRAIRNHSWMKGFDWNSL